MKWYFPIDNNSNELYQEIGATIKEFYPLGSDRDSRAYNEHAGILKINDQINSQMLHYNSYMKPWKLFLKSLPRGYKSSVQNNSFAHEISFSGKITLDTFKNEKVIIEKSLHFSVSGLAKYFNIHGIDETCILLKEDKDSYNRGAYYAINAVTVSPYMEFENPFNYVFKSITEHFPDYKFIPFNICQAFVKGLQTPHSNLQECTVYNALFRDVYDCSCIQQLRGDWYFESGKSNVEVSLMPPPL